MKPKIIIGMSGGVDSSVAAALLLEQGYQVTGATFRLWKPNEALRQNAERDIADARQVCKILGIPHLVLDLQGEFRTAVVEDFVREYQAGRTPSPCITCNKTIKFGLFFDRAAQLGFDCIATGHYAQIVEQNGQYQLKKAVDLQKDQSYFLYGIPYRRLRQIVFPLGGLTKSQVRVYAAQHGLARISNKRDSQEVCFIDQAGYGAFLQAYTRTHPSKGRFVDHDGNDLGEHQGIWYYTVGQRKGLGIAFGKPMYVERIIPQDNTVLLAEENELYRRTMQVGDLCYCLPEPLTKPAELEVKIRNRAKPAKAVVHPNPNHTATVTFWQPQRAVTAGQSAVFYQENTVWGGGKILG